MQNHHQTVLQKDALLHAHTAINKLTDLAENILPEVSRQIRLRLLIECLLEITEEEKWVDAQ